MKGYMYNVATNSSCHSNMFNVYNLYLFQFITIYICFSSLWSKRGELWKKSEEDKVKLLDMCSASEDNKGLIRHGRGKGFQMSKLM